MQWGQTHLSPVEQLHQMGAGEVPLLWSVWSFPRFLSSTAKRHGSSVGMEVLVSQTNPSAPSKPRMQVQATLSSVYLASPRPD